MKFSHDDLVRVFIIRLERMYKNQKDFKVWLKSTLEGIIKAHERDILIMLKEDKDGIEIFFGAFLVALGRFIIKHRHELMVGFDVLEGLTVEKATEEDKEERLKQLQPLIVKWVNPETGEVIKEEVIEDTALKEVKE